MIRWQVITRYPGLGAVDDQPPGWEPFAVSEGKIWLRRPIDYEPPAVAPPRWRVLSASELAARERALGEMQRAKVLQGLPP